jgi:hypothetical protein
MPKDDFTKNAEYLALKDMEGFQLLGDEDKNNPPPGGDTPPAGDPPAAAASPPAGATNEPVKSHDDFLKEIFGDKFKSVDEAKQAVGQLEEMDGLRRTNTELQSKLTSKPKTNFVNDEVALFNEFVRETGINNYGVFSKLNGADTANMDPLDAIVTRHILKHPKLAGQESKVRKMFERNFNVNPDEVDEDQLEINKINLISEGEVAARELQEVKSKLKIPEPDNTPEPVALSPEQKASLQKSWDIAGDQVTQVIGKMPVSVKGGKPVLSYEFPQDELQKAKEFIVEFAVQNQMELNQENIQTIGQIVKHRIVLNNLEGIVQAVFERARNMTENEVHAIYENPTPSRNNDQPPAGHEQVKSQSEKDADAIFDAEMGRYKI